MLFLLLSLQWMGSAVACSCVPPPDNATLFERAKVLVDAEVVKVVDTVQIQGGRLPSVVEMEIKKVYKGAQSLIGKKVKVSGK